MTAVAYQYLILSRRARWTITVGDAVFTGPTMQICANQAERAGKTWTAGDVTENAGCFDITLIGPDGSEQQLYRAVNSDWSGLPHAALMRTLNRLGQDGWRVVSTEEDKGLYLGVDTQDESFPTRVRVLLARAG